MTTCPESSPIYSRRAPIGIRLACALLAFAVVAVVAPAQISLNTAVDLALRSNPRVKGAQDDVRKANDQLAQTHDVYIPSLSAGADIGQAYGYSEYPPTLFTMTSGSMIYNTAQSSYVRSARAGLKAAQLSLEDTSEQVAEDTAIAFIALAHDQQREQVIGQQTGYANDLVTIVQQRVDAGQDTQIDLTQAKITAAQLRLVRLRAVDDTAYDREHLARLIDLPPASLSAGDSFPTTPLDLDSTASAPANGDANSAVASAFANADARLQQAKGDSKFRYRPVINLFAVYNRYATFSDSFKSLDKLYGNNLTANEAAFGVQISLPLFDRARQARARESYDAAARAQHDAQEAQIDALDAQGRLRHGVAELQAQAEVATLQQQYAQQQLDVIHLQQQSGNPNGPQMTPKDEQNARIAERDKYLAVVDAGFQLRQSEIQLLRQQGKLLAWLASAASSSPSTLPVPPSPQP
jgi:outer membrane protein TolC